MGFYIEVLSSRGNEEADARFLCGISKGWLDSEPTTRKSGDDDLDARERSG